MATNVGQEPPESTNLGSSSESQCELTSDPPECQESVDAFGDSECGPLSTQELKIDFSPSEDYDNEILQKKCCDFLTFIHSHQELNHLIVFPDAELSANAASSSNKAAPVRCEEPPLTALPSATSVPINAFSMLQFVEGKGLIDRVFEAKLQKKECSLGSREYVYSERNTKISKKKMEKLKKKSQEQRRTGPAVSASSSSTQLTAMCEELREWDNRHPKRRDERTDRCVRALLAAMIAAETRLALAQLASPLIHIKEAMRDMITSNSPTGFGVYTGIHSFFSKGDYLTIEGKSLASISHVWAKGEPDNFQDKENCIVMLADGSLADVDCKDTYPYLCYKPNPAKPLVTSVCGTTDPEYSLYSETGSCYKFHRVPRTWNRAFTTCLAEGGYLAIINSQTEADVIKKIFLKNLPAKILGFFWKDVAFIGFHDWGQHGDWLTIHGETLSAAGYSKFAPAEPNNSTTGEYCGAVYRSALLDDLWCGNHYAFMCEKHPNSLNCLLDD